MITLQLGISSSSAQSVNISEYAIPTPNSTPLSIAAGPDGAQWFVEQQGNKIGRITPAGVITEYPLPTASASPEGMTAGPDGALWFTETNANKIGRISPSGVITEYPIPRPLSEPSGITTGPDGALWFTGTGGGIGVDGITVPSQIGLITADGVFTEYELSSPGSGPIAIATGPDGALWFTELGSGSPQIGRITTAGVVTEYPIVSFGPGIQGITAGSDGAMWFSAGSAGIGRITTAGVVTYYTLPTAGNSAHGVTASSDGAVWFTESGPAGTASKIGRITVSGTITEYPLPTGNADPYAISGGPAGALWFTEQGSGGGNKIGRIESSLSSFTPLGVNPAAGSGTSGMFTFVFSDSAGWQSLTVVDILISNTLDGRLSCYLAFVPSGTSGSVYLVDDMGDAGGPYSGLTLPGSGVAQNSQCSITAAGSSFSGTGNTLTVNLPITFAPGFAGNKVIYLAARDASSNSGWQPLGTWNVPGAPITGPGVGAMTPARSSSSTGVFTFTFTDTAGWQDISVANVLINSAINGIAACYFAFVPSAAGSGAVLLVDDAGDAGGPYSGMLLPGNGTAQNRQCTISGMGSSVMASGNTLTLTLALTFAQNFVGNQVFYLAARSNTASSGWQPGGSITVPLLD